MNGGCAGLVSDRLQEFVADANEALRFRLVRSGDDVQEATREDQDREGDFAPEMTHQIYGEKYIGRDLLARVRRLLH